MALGWPPLPRLVLTLDNMTSIYGSSCATNGKDALDTPEGSHAGRILPPLLRLVLAQGRWGRTLPGARTEKRGLESSFALSMLTRRSLVSLAVSKLERDQSSEYPHIPSELAAAPLSRNRAGDAIATESR